METASQFSNTFCDHIILWPFPVSCANLLPTPNLSPGLHPCPLLSEAHSPWSNLSNWMLFIINITLLIRTITLDQTFLLTPNSYYKLDNSNSLKTVIRQLKICTIYLYLHIHPSNGATLTGVAFQIFFLYYSICIFFFKVLQENVPQDTSWPLYPENNDVLQGLSPQNCFLCPLLYTPHVPDPGPHKCSHKLCVTLTFHNVFFFFNFIGMELSYNVVLISGVKWISYT